MADPADNAQEAVEQTVALANAARQARPSLPVGRCLECDDATPGSFCCPECRDSYERKIKLNRINGRG